MEALKMLEVGTVHTLQKKVTIEDTSLKFGSGKIDNLFATPRLVAFLIEASSAMIDPSLPEGYVSIGHHVEVDHFKPSTLGATITVEVRIVKVDRWKYTIQMKAYDDFGQIGVGKHTRSVIQHKILMDKASLREMQLENEG